MCHFVELRLNGRVYGGMVVTMDVCPDGRIAIDVFTTVTVPKNGALALDQHDGFVIGRAPCLHLRKRVPDVPLFSEMRGSLFTCGHHGAVDTTGSTTFSSRCPR